MFVPPAVSPSLHLTAETALLLYVPHDAAVGYGRSTSSGSSRGPYKERASYPDIVGGSRCRCGHVGILADGDKNNTCVA